LGPYPELFERGIKFFVDPKRISLENSTSSSKKRNDDYIKHHNFAIEAIVTPVTDSGFIRIDFHVSPYHNFVKGFGLQVNHSGNLDILEIPITVNQSVDSSQIYNFTLKTSLPRPGISNLVMGFYAPNPEFESYQARGKRTRDKIGTQIELTIGADDKGNILFISEYISMRQLQKVLNERKLSYYDLDRRYNILSNFDNPPRGRITRSEGFEELIKGKKINNNRRIRNR